MIAGMIGKVLLRELPGYVAKQIVSRQAHVYGSVIYSPPQRRVLGYLQEAAPLALTGWRWPTLPQHRLLRPLSSASSVSPS